LDFVSNVPRAVALILFRPRRAWLLGRIGLATILLSLVIRLRPLPSALASFSVATNDDGKVLGPSAAELVTAVDAVLGMNLSVFRPVCWKRAILLHRLLGLRGYGTTIVFGVRASAKEQVAGHAWLERDGLPIFESTPPDCVVTYRFPSNESCDVDLQRMD
jgi:Transglutaminase-like superfamily